MDYCSSYYFESNQRLHSCWKWKSLPCFLFAGFFFFIFALYSFFFSVLHHSHSPTLIPPCHPPRLVLSIVIYLFYLPFPHWDDLLTSVVYADRRVVGNQEMSHTYLSSQAKTYRCINRHFYVYFVHFACMECVIKFAKWTKK